MTKMKRYVWGLPLVVAALVGLTWSSLSRPVPQGSAAQNNGFVAGTAVTLGQVTRGIVFYTAGINSDGTVAACFNCNTANTFRISPGAYQVDFGTDVEATNGWSRWVQPDTLTTGTTSVFCDAADRAGDTNAVWINCQNSAGTPTDSSFFLFVAR